ncbi:putative 4-hydroxybenzoate geranyltransferase [Rosa chinensis]|uniref:Putative 4-hydroxybenzoate geranyltransferase n=1 Tax=Rosa chinensis TaxID=74649 RepID=A0A2P6QDR0_ROSCH|nr:putative 4-hydroxybenzoate geranyltransferase [Rosa chinensis]
MSRASMPSCGGCTKVTPFVVVERTKLRPIASGLLTPFKGLCFLGFQLLLGLGILLQLNNYRLVPHFWVLELLTFNL